MAVTNKLELKEGVGKHLDNCQHNLRGGTISHYPQGALADLPCTPYCIFATLSSKSKAPLAEASGVYQLYFQ